MKVKVLRESPGRMCPDDDHIRHFMAPKEYLHLCGEHRYIEVRYDDEKRETVDEICTTQVHLEGMDTNKVWMLINGVHVWFTSRTAITVTCDPDTAEPVEVEP